MFEYRKYALIAQERRKAMRDIVMKKATSYVLTLVGKEGKVIFDEIKNAPQKPYNAKKESRKAAKELRRQGLLVW